MLWRRQRLLKAQLRCVGHAPNTEHSYCATSLESLVDYGISKLGKNVQVFSTDQVPKDTDKVTSKSTTTALQKCIYRINADMKIVCHRQNYAHVVFPCHEIPDARTYMVPLLESGDQGRRVNAIAACHTGASAAAEAFKVLRVKPGSVAICRPLP